ncbi:MAG TPA: hypothetical protein VGE98_13585, partial [Thermoanaerobaculia bacterium]
MKRILPTLAGLYACGALAAAAQAPVPHREAVRKWTVGGVERQALVFTPAAITTGTKAPLLLVFHGHGGNMNGAARQMNFQAYWP